MVKLCIARMNPLPFVMCQVKNILQSYKDSALRAQCTFDKNFVGEIFSTIMHFDSSKVWENLEKLLLEGNISEHIIYEGLAVHKN